MLYDLMSNPNNHNKKKKTNKENNYHYYQLCVLYKMPWFSNYMYCTVYGEIRPHRQTHTPKTVPAAQYVQYCSYFTHCIYCAIQIVSYMPLYTMQIVSILYVLYTQCVLIHTVHTAPFYGSQCFVQVLLVRSARVRVIFPRLATAPGGHRFL